MNALMKEQMNLLPDDQETKWQAVLTKDARCDGQFVFAVSSTGITVVRHVVRDGRDGKTFPSSSRLKAWSRAAFARVAAAIRAMQLLSIRRFK